MKLTHVVDSLCDPHVHLREEDVLDSLVKLSLRGGARVLGPMPNTNQGLKTTAQVIEYIARAKQSVPSDVQVEFLPIAMLTEATTNDEIKVWASAGIKSAKVYPRDRTTKSQDGARNYARLCYLAKVCGWEGIKCHLHPEHPSLIYDNSDAEYAFLPIMDMLLQEAGKTVFVWEHGTDVRCILHWKEMAKTGRFFVGITPHHLLGYEDLVYGDSRATCKPSFKGRISKEALGDLVRQGYSWVMATPDSAPHDYEAKHPPSGRCACGVFHSPFLLPLYAHALNDLLQTGDGLVKFLDFTSRNARRLHGLPYPSREKVYLVKKPFQIPLSYDVGPWKVQPFMAGQTIDWSLE